MAVTPLDRRKNYQEFNFIHTATYACTFFFYFRRRKETVDKYTVL